MNKTLILTFGLLAACSTPTSGYHPDDCAEDNAYYAYTDGYESAANASNIAVFCDEGLDWTPHTPDYPFGERTGIPLLEACFTFGWDAYIEIAESECAG